MGEVIHTQQCRTAKAATSSQSLKRIFNSCSSLSVIKSPYSKKSSKKHKKNIADSLILFVNKETLYRYSQQSFKSSIIGVAEIITTPFLISNKVRQVLRLMIL